MIISLFIAFDCSMQQKRLSRKAEKRNVPSTNLLTKIIQRRLFTMFYFHLMASFFVVWSSMNRQHSITHIALISCVSDISTTNCTICRSRRSLVYDRILFIHSTFFSTHRHPHSMPKSEKKHFVIYHNVCWRRKIALKIEWINMKNQLKTHPNHFITENTSSFFGGVVARRYFLVQWAVRSNWFIALCFFPSIVLQCACNLGNSKREQWKKNVEWEIHLKGTVRRFYFIKLLLLLSELLYKMDEDYISFWINGWTVTNCDNIPEENESIRESSPNEIRRWIGSFHSHSGSNGRQLISSATTTK